MKTLLFLGLALVLSSCSDDESNDTPNTIDCTTLVETECLAEPSCQAFYGSKIDQTAMCVGSEEMIACGNAESAECNNSIVGYVSDSNGTCWYQNSACFAPTAGFEAGSDLSEKCPSVTEACQPVDCRALAEADCLAEPECLAVYGRKIDETAMCVSNTKEMMACATLSASECPNNAVGFAIDPDGTCWFQPSVCSNIGEGYQTNAPFGTGTCPEITELCP
jgi:hypothetical protein